MKARRVRFVVAVSGGALLLAALVAGQACTPPAEDTGSEGSGGSRRGTGGTKGGGTGSGGTNGGGTGSGGTTGGTGSGGTTGGTGSGGTTGGGTGGASTARSKCGTKTKLMNPVLLDFENYKGDVTADKYGTAFGGAMPNTGTAYTGIYVHPEVKGGTPNPTLEMKAGYPPSNWAVSETLHATTWGMGGGVWMSCADASAYKGLSFRVRGSSGTGTFSFALAMDSTIPRNNEKPAEGGTCPGTTEDACAAAVKKDLPLTMDWTEVRILWADFTPGLSGTTPVNPDGNDIVGMAWSVPLKFEPIPNSDGGYGPVAADVRIDIDDIGFIAQ